ncbi:hypothetical protein [Pseudoalteromonas luteoviolacea]|uniref:Uncharacterized protein n=1 Tax=Pseudoalteromonas luteoviolacea DSM 6061 TaxID=1365250 RepID=A0A166WNP0_9GAMM|nr:hypothetical protein [Pseudoalteromonas luteoviolacea]KZN37692.1 hypothetical protein N475_02450 [Pseudoalteromonas luteoviolacea DSM 6061]KZN60717.1 hypothetical protein N474_00615 [Pseudoalteromonas luteoviolacea CPMOR-2]MBE0386883.1 hypothetical protein [Pseudoalteromonas luteoviolacea DSM 6061]TQF71700.1 hypothetical protein FLM44_11715 [Pseudoalteromonas luteoviolacea]
MAINPKKQTLLNKSEFQKQQANKKKKQRLSPQQQMRQQALQQQNMQAATAEAPAKKGIKRLIFIGVLAIAVILFPKPQLITYKKLGLVAQSVYWPGLPGVKPILFDSVLQPVPALDRDTLYLCQDVSNPDTCQKYAIIKQEGFFAALKSLLMD